MSMLWLADVWQWPGFLERDRFDPSSRTPVTKSSPRLSTRHRIPRKTLAVLDRLVGRAQRIA